MCMSMLYTDAFKLVIHSAFNNECDESCYVQGLEFIAQLDAYNAKGEFAPCDLARARQRMYTDRDSLISLLHLHMFTDPQ